MSELSRQIFTKTEASERLNSILSELGVKGEILNILVALLTETVWMAELGSFTTLRESNLLTATQLASMLAICHENFTRVDRGSCQRITISNLISLDNKDLTAFTQMSSKAPHTVYYLRDAHYDQNESNIGLELIVGKELESFDDSGEIDRRLTSSSFILDIPGDRWSEDFLFYKNKQQIYNVDDIPVDLHNDDKYLGKMYTKRARQLGPNIPYYFATTAPNYGIRVYGYYRFSENDFYTFKGIRLMDPDKPDLDPMKITEIPGFVFKDSVISESDVKNVPSTREDSDISRLKALTLAEFRDRNYISSKNAVIGIIKLELQEYLAGFTINVLDGKILITYVPKPNVGFGESEKDAFKKKVIFDYKITEELVFEEAKPKYVRLFLNIHYDNTINEMEVYKLIDSFENQVGGVYSLSKVKSALSKLPTVSYVDDIKPEGTYKWCQYRPADLETPLEEEVLERPGEAEGPTNKKIKLIYQLRFDVTNETGNEIEGGGGKTSQKVVLLTSSQTTNL